MWFMVDSKDGRTYCLNTDQFRSISVDKKEITMIKAHRLPIDENWIDIKFSDILRIETTHTVLEGLELNEQNIRHLFYKLLLNK